MGRHAVSVEKIDPNSAKRDPTAAGEDTSQVNGKISWSLRETRAAPHKKRAAGAFRMDVNTLNNYFYIIT